MGFDFINSNKRRDAKFAETRREKVKKALATGGQSLLVPLANI